MSAHLYCWAPSLGLDPEAADFQDKLGALLEEEAPPAPSPRLVAFVESLLTRYPDLTETDDAVWAKGPLAQCIVGDFIDMAMFIDMPTARSLFVEAVTFVIETARKHGLYFYEPQGGGFVPVSAAGEPRIVKPRRMP